MSHSRSIKRTALAVLCLMPICGCAVRTPADNGRYQLEVPERIDAASWPERHPDDLARYLESREIAPLSALRSPPPITLPPNLETLRRQIHQAACMRRLTLHNADYIHRGGWGEGIVFESSWTAGDGPDRYCVLLSRLTTPTLNRTLSSPAPLQVGAEGIDRFHFVLRRTTAAVRRGLVVHAVSIGDLQYEKQVIDELRSRGWDTLTCIPRGFTIGLLAGYNEYGESTGPHQLITPLDLAGNLDNYLASSACAIESMLLHLDEVDPQRDDNPTLLIGFSLGALSVPTIAARLGDRVDAAILVGGGTNIARILIEGDLTRDLRGTVRRELGPAGLVDLSHLSERYLIHSQLDPFYTAQHLTHTPVLMLQASFDGIVPAATGRDLYDKLGRPERWSYPLGHLGLFWWLPTQKERIADWVDKTLPTGR